MATYEQVYDALAALPKKEMILATCKIVREQAWDKMTDERSRKLVEAAEGYVNGTVTKEEFGRVRDAASACAAAWDAHYASACAVASSTGSAAHYAASACASASAAHYAASAASDASVTYSVLSDRQLEIIAEFSKKEPVVSEGLVELLEKALEVAKKLAK